MNEADLGDQMCADQKANRSGSDRDPPSTGECLVIFFRPRLTLAIARGDPGSDIALAGVRFRAIGEDYLTAFYDKVQNRDGAFVGLEITPIAQEEGIPNLVSRFDYTRPVDANRRFQVILAGPKGAEVTSTSDQAFGGRVYRSNSGDLAISIDLGWLEDSEVRTIKGVDADWVTIPGV